jgi:membrane-associated phospholipid phosphatase
VAHAIDCRCGAPGRPGAFPAYKPRIPSSGTPLIRSNLLRRFLLGIATACTLGVGQVQAQITSNPDSVKKAGKPLFTRDDALLAIGFAGLTIAMFPVDKSVAKRLRSPSSNENQFISRVTTGSEYLADPGTIIIGSGMYLVGRFTHHNTLADVGLHTTEAIVLGSGVTMVLKDVLGRSRPFVTNATDPRDFNFGKGFGNGDYQSFPSGHTTAAFAAASSLTSEVHRVYPHLTWIAGPIFYGGATTVGLARMYHNKHWASDVALGAAIGTFSGLKVVRYSHNHPDNRIDKLLLRTVVQPNGNGGELAGLSIPWTIGY